MRTSFHHRPEAQHPNFPLSVSWQADYPIFRGEADMARRRAAYRSVADDQSGHRRDRNPALQRPPVTLPWNRRGRKGVLMSDSLRRGTEGRRPCQHQHWKLFAR